jgi:hypothetical protein
MRELKTADLMRLRTAAALVVGGKRASRICWLFDI